MISFSRSHLDEILIHINWCCLTLKYKIFCWVRMNGLLSTVISSNVYIWKEVIWRDVRLRFKHVWKVSSDVLGKYMMTNATSSQIQVRPAFQLKIKSRR